MSSKPKNINRTIAASEGSDSHVGIHTISGAQSSEQELFSLLPAVPNPEYNPHLTHSSKIRVFFFQFLAMFVFFYGVTCAHFPGNQVQPYMDMQVVTALTLGVAISARISGSNVNPAISFCHVIRRDHKYTPQMYGIFFLAQMFGGFMTLILAEALNGVTFEALVPADGQMNFLGGLRIVLSEAMGIGLLIFFVLQLTNPQIAIRKNNRSTSSPHPHAQVVPYIEHPFFALVYVIIFVYLGIKYAPMQGSINPAINLCTAIISDIREGKVEGLLYCWIWIIGDLVGVFAGVLLYEKVYEPNVRGVLREKVKDLIRAEQGSSKESEIDSLAKQELEELDQKEKQKGGQQEQF